MMTPHIAIKIDSPTPIVVNNTLVLKCGFFESDYSLTDVTSTTTFTLLYPLDGTVTQNDNEFVTATPQSIGIEASYSTYIATLNLQVLTPLFIPSQQDIYNLLKQEEPEGVYTTSQDTSSLTYDDNFVTAGLMADASANLYNAYLNIFPDRATDLTDWYIQAFGRNIITPAHPNALVQQISQLRLVPTINKFLAMYNISQFIYNLTGFNVGVSVGDLVVNQFDYWYLDGSSETSDLGVNTYLFDSGANGSVITICNSGIITFNQQQITLINNFIKSIIRPTKGYTISYDKTLASGGFIFDRGATYNGDIRVNKVSCMVYDKAYFYNAHLYTALDLSFVDLVSFTVSPISGSSVGSFTQMTILGTFNNGQVLDISLLMRTDREDENCLIAWATVLAVVKPSTTVFTLTPGPRTDLTQTITYNMS